MIIFKRISDLQQWLHKRKIDNKILGFVPTMGALHQGHISLIEHSIAKTDITVCSIFINPTQFNDVNDYAKYPVTLENDIRLLESVGTDILFLPFTNEIYPEGLGVDVLEHYDLGKLETILEGFYRPGHFQGVCNVVNRLLKIVDPDLLLLGQKDYQQCMVLKKMIDIKNLRSRIEIVSTLRENNGLAMSSRNIRLTPEGIEIASTIFKALNYINENFTKINLEDCKSNARNMILSAGFEKVDYVEICDFDTLEPLAFKNKTNKAVALVAAFIEGVRLIDNIQIG